MEATVKLYMDEPLIKNRKISFEILLEFSEEQQIKMFSTYVAKAKAN